MTQDKYSNIFTSPLKFINFTNADDIAIFMTKNRNTEIATTLHCWDASVPKHNDIFYI